ncbi:MAG: hypothetical protein Q8859_14300, partial [Bacteroidota bacterium]|nr:hypothetical protein [Bacteroidota bacterium]
YTGFFSNTKFHVQLLFDESTKIRFELMNRLSFFPSREQRLSDLLRLNPFQFLNKLKSFSLIRQAIHHSV